MMVQLTGLFRCWKRLSHLILVFSCIQETIDNLGPVPGFEGLFVAAGHGRNGIYLSTGTAAVMAGVILGEEPPFSLFDFRADRH